MHQRSVAIAYFKRWLLEFTEFFPQAKVAKLDERYTIEHLAKPTRSWQQLHKWGTGEFCTYCAPSTFPHPYILPIYQRARDACLEYMKGRPA